MEAITTRLRDRTRFPFVVFGEDVVTSPETKWYHYLLLPLILIGSVNMVVGSIVGLYSVLGFYIEGRFYAHWYQAAGQLFVSLLGGAFGSFILWGCVVLVVALPMRVLAIAAQRIEFKGSLLVIGAILFVIAKTLLIWQGFESN